MSNAAAEHTDPALYAVKSLVARCPIPVSLKTPEESFDRCKPVSALVSSHLSEHGVEASWVQLHGFLGDTDTAVRQWQRLHPRSWSHYVSVVWTSPADGQGPCQGWVIDLTATQFDPNAQTIRTWEDVRAQWRDIHDVTDHVDTAAALARAEFHPQGAHGQHA